MFGKRIKNFKKVQAIWLIGSASDEEALMSNLEIFFNNGGEITAEGLFVPIPVDYKSGASYNAYAFIRDEYPGYIAFLHSLFLNGKVDSEGAEIVNLKMRSFL